jgi:predicted phage terminase large subunit-like protein
VADIIGSRTEIIDGMLAQLDGPALVRRIKELDRQYEPDLILIESIGGGRVLYQFLVDQGVQRLQAIPSHGRNSKIERMEVVTPIVESGKVALLRGAAFVPQSLDDIAAFPDGLSDDYSDALSQLSYHREKVVQAAMWNRKRNPRSAPDPPETFPRYRSPYGEPCSHLRVPID